MKTLFIATLALVGIAVSVPVWAHTPLLSCFDEGDGSVTCEGGFSDGSSASGVEFRLEQDGKILLKTKLNAYAEVNFTKPELPYEAIFYGGKGHEVRINGGDIF
ncbi:MAG: hypothetical protein RBR43_03585 [Desulfuromonadaceae bacterium]|nr:hypothetical protein [Desulfuromonas sp.]MDY0184949.1 hypothetical protein [Desulfuromonadaceae bacterium]